MDNLLNLLAGMRWQDIADITINSYILFRLYVLFRGTYVLRVLIGLALLGVLYLVQRPRIPKTAVAAEAA